MAVFGVLSDTELLMYSLVEHDDKYLVLRLIHSNRKRVADIILVRSNLEHFYFELFALGRLFTALGQWHRPLSRGWKWD